MIGHMTYLWAVLVSGLIRSVMGVYDVMTGITLWRELPKESQVLVHR